MQYVNYVCEGAREAYGCDVLYLDIYTCTIAIICKLYVW